MAEDLRRSSCGVLMENSEINGCSAGLAGECGVEILISFILILSWNVVCLECCNWNHSEVTLILVVFRLLLYSVGGGLSILNGN